MKNATKSQLRMSLDDAEILLDKQLRKLELVDEEDQTSYKTIDYQLRNAETIKSMVDTKIRLEIIRQNSVRQVESVKNHGQLKQGN